MKTICFSLFSVTAPAIVAAQVVSFEAACFPEDAQPPWLRSDRPFLPDRWIQDGWFVQQTDVASYDPYEEEDDFYRRAIAEYAGVPSFFAEWRMQTDGNHDWFIDVAPAVLTLSGTMGVRFHFAITRDRFRLIDSYVDEYYFDIDAAFPHTYRVEVRQTNADVFLDGQHIHAGTTPRAYPGPDSVIVFGARAPGETATTRWDYIRYGVIPDDAGAGDLNCDGTINQFDIHPFIAALASADGYGQQHPACNRLLADANADGSVNQFDILPFVDLLMP